MFQGMGEQLEIKDIVKNTILVEKKFTNEQFC